MSLRPFLTVGLLILLGIACGCGNDGERGRVIVLALDGMDPRAVDLLMSEGKLPHFAKLRQEGAYAPLTSAKPLLSPVVWTTVATGKTPDRHRIGHFIAVNRATGERLPVTSSLREVKALWNIASDRERDVAVVGWWATWPAETVRGSIVSDHLCYHFLFEEGLGGSSDPDGLTFPPELAGELEPLIRRPADLTLDEAAEFVRVSRDEFSRPFSFDDDLSHFRWALATGQTYRNIGLELWERDRPDLLMVYIEGTDSTSHLFGHLFRAEGLAGELAEQQQRYGETVERMYVYADRLLGEFMEVMDGRTTLVVLSDHGFELGRLQEDPSKTRDMRRVSERYHTIEGVLYMYGNRVKGYGRFREPTILDIAPTVLALLGLPPAADMPGRVLAEALHVVVPPAVPTYETGTGTGVAAQTDDIRVNQEILDRLTGLGYLGAGSPEGDRNLAAVLFQEGRHEEAAEAYRELLEADPDDGAARASLAGVLGALGRYDEALEQITLAIRLDPLNSEAYHNRGVIYERRGDTEAAIREYRVALRYNPQYEPTRQALMRLTGGAALPGPVGPARQRASDLAEQAAETARRGDYARALGLLDEAERVAPDYALILQYRSNVCYLKGDRDCAIAALERGLELEPGNALFRENLDAMERSGPEP